MSPSNTVLRSLFWIFIVFLTWNIRYGIGITPYETRGAPGYLPTQMAYLELVALQKIENMTYEIYANLFQQISLVGTVRDNYKNSITYELGMVAARLQSSFEHMLTLYRFYADYDKFKMLEPELEKMTIAYHIIQGDYNKIRLDKKLFRDIRQRHQEEESRQEEALQEHGFKYEGASKHEIDKYLAQQQRGGRSGDIHMGGDNKRRLWAPNSDKS